MPRHQLRHHKWLFTVELQEVLLIFKPFYDFLGGGLVPDDLYLLDIRQGEDKAQWIMVPVVGTTPGRRYGHSLVFCKPYLLVFGGNTGNEPVNDVWCLNVERAPFFWMKLECPGDNPVVRVYHSAALCT